MSQRESISKLVADVKLPRMFKVRQSFPRPRIDPADIPAKVQEVLSEERFAKKVQPGMNIAITVGSRGVANVAIITKAIADFVKSRGASPFIIPTMGSHGGATAEGQAELIASYGVTEEAMGCPIRSSMEVVKIGETEDGLDVLIDKYGAESDGIIVSCRVKPHTGFRGPYESGIMKMLAIGLGKQQGAEVCHEAGFKNMARYVPMFGKAILKNAPILFAVPTIENAYDETYRLLAVDADEVADVEPELLKDAFAHMPRIMVDECDVLVVDRVGKNYSGDGMDPNITGTHGTPYASGGLKSQRVAVLGMSEETHGNALGLGVAHATTQAVVDAADLTAMYYNVITSTVIEGARIPMIMANQKEAIQVCLRTCVETDKQNPYIVRIPNSLHVEYIWLSEAYLDVAKSIEGLEIVGEPEDWPFDAEGNLF